jgi:hypothetical protein
MSSPGPRPSMSVNNCSRTRALFTPSSSPPRFAGPVDNISDQYFFTTGDN